MTDSLPTIRAIACNSLISHGGVSRDAKHYLLDPNAGNASDRIYLLARSKSGRWVRKWLNPTKLTNFRLVSLSAENPTPYQAVVEYGYYPSETREEWSIQKLCTYLNDGGWDGSRHNTEAKQSTWDRLPVEYETELKGGR